MKCPVMVWIFSLFSHWLNLIFYNNICNNFKGYISFIFFQRLSWNMDLVCSAPYKIRPSLHLTIETRISRLLSLVLWPFSVFRFFPYPISLFFYRWVQHTFLLLSTNHIWILHFTIKNCYFAWCTFCSLFLAFYFLPSLPLERSLIDINSKRI